MKAANENAWEKLARLRRALLDVGEIEWERRLREAMTISSMPGEIVGETRSALTQLRRSRTARRLGLASLIKEILLVFK